MFLLGSTPEVLSKLAFNLKQGLSALKISCQPASRFRKVSEAEHERDVNLIKDSKASVVLVGLGCLSREVWVSEMVGRLQIPCLAVDAHSGA